MQYEVNVNNNLDLNLVYKNGKFIIDEQEFNIDLLKANGGYSVLHNNKSFFIRLLSYDEKNKLFSFKINESIYNVFLSDAKDVLLKKMNINYKTQKKASNLKSPMPGLIVNINVKKGLSVKKGEPLLILEAMKMENLIKAPNDLLIKKICVNPGDIVGKNELLIEFD